MAKTLDNNVKTLGNSAGKTLPGASQTFDRSSGIKSLQTPLTQMDQVQRGIQRASTRLNHLGEFDFVDYVGENPYGDRGFVKEALGLQPNQGFIADIFEILRKPLESVKGMADSGIDGAVSGFTGQEKFRWSEILGLNYENKLATFLIDLAGDIILDPLTYIPIFG